MCSAHPPDAFLVFVCIQRLTCHLSAHCDAAYRSDNTGGHIVETYYTVHLYLNDQGLVGGATAFLSRDRTKRLDVNPKAGSVLIFQHPLLLHEGAEVIEGTKYTVRTEIMYRWEDEGRANLESGK